MNSFYLAALATGMAGSMHCLGMCGPLMAGIGARHCRWGSLFRQMLLHHGGRIAGYMLMGLVMGAAGQLVSLVLIQRWLMLLAGAMILLTILFSVKTVSGAVFTRMMNLVSRATGIRAGSNAGMLLLGFFNGLLPCGLVYAAAAGAMATASWWQGLLFMLLFGLANSPVLMLAASWHRVASLKLQLRSRYWKTVPLVIIGLFFLLKGAGLGIPGISPAFTGAHHKPACCRPAH
jgi:sulfite exporter TauE/SafE